MKLTIQDVMEAILSATPAEVAAFQLAILNKTSPADATQLSQAATRKVSPVRETVTIITRRTMADGSVQVRNHTESHEFGDGVSNPCIDEWTQIKP